MLKGLIEDGLLALSDGRRLVDATRHPCAGNDISIHGDFRCILLANKAGFPFLGNDLFREMGDVVSPLVIENPDRESETVLLQSYAPRVNGHLIAQLVSVFQDLRNSVDAGLLLYPYSTREAVAIGASISKRRNGCVLS